MLVKVLKILFLTLIPVLLGQTLNENRKPLPDEVLNELKAEVQKHPDSAGAFYDLGRAYADLGRSTTYDKAIEALIKAIQLKPDYAEAYCRLGEAYHKFHVFQELTLNHPEEEVQAYNKALLLRPNYAEAYVGLGHSCIRFDARLVLDQEPLKQAADYFRQAILVSPKNREAYRGLEAVYTYQGRHAEAIEVSKQVILLNTDDAWAYRDLTDFCLKSRECDRVVTAYNDLINKIGDKTDIYVGLGACYLYSRQYEDAVGVLERAIRIRPDDPFGNYYLGVAYLSLGDKERAKKQYELLNKLSLRQTLAGQLYKERAQELIFKINH